MGTEGLAMCSGTVDDWMSDGGASGMMFRRGSKAGSYCAGLGYLFGRTKLLPWRMATCRGRCCFVLEGHCQLRQTYPKR
jgi:hypothetical protein